MTKEEFDRDMDLFKRSSCAHDMYDLAYEYIEALQAHKTCELCVYGEPVLSGNRIWCKSDKVPFGNIHGMSFTKTFYCSEYSVKDTQC